MKEKRARNLEIYQRNVKGLGARKLAKLYNITPQRVTQIIQMMRKVSLEKQEV